MDFGKLLSGALSAAIGLGKKMNPLGVATYEFGKTEPTTAPRTSKGLINPQADYDFTPSPTPTITTAPSPAPTPTPMPSDNPRNPNWGQWKRNNPKGFEELLSGAKLASTKHGVPAGLLMDVSGLETSGGTQLNPPMGHTASGYFMFNQPTINDPYLPAKVPSGFDPMSATDSADLAAQLIRKKQLSRWAVLNTPGAGKNMLTDFYSPEELAPYLP